MSEEHNDVEVTKKSSDKITAKHLLMPKNRLFNIYLDVVDVDEGEMSMGIEKNYRFIDDEDEKVAGDYNSMIMPYYKTMVDLLATNMMSDGEPLVIIIKKEDIQRYYSAFKDASTYETYDWSPATLDVLNEFLSIFGKRFSMEEDMGNGGVS